MRITLRKQITTALMLFGLVPASIVAVFAFLSNDDYKDSKKILIRQAAWAIAEHLGPLLPASAKGEVGDPEVVLNLEQKERDALDRAIKIILLDQFRLDTAQVYFLDPSDRIVLRVKETGELEFNPSNPKRLFIRYPSVATKANGHITTEELGPSTIPTKSPAEVVGCAPVQLASGPSNTGQNSHGYVVLTIVPRKDAYQTIYENQFWILLILGAALVLTVILGIVYGRRFVRPLLEIIEVTHQLQEGQLYNRTHVRRGDELGELAAQVNSVVDKWSELISQIRTMTASVSTASNQLNSSAHQLAQGSAEQAATLQEIAGSLQSVDASVGRNAQHARDTARMANEASAQAERGGEAVRETVVAMREITQKILIVDDIAYQTNLLALNAAIEAARAGTHGKGFAVVAGEVRKLAERSQAAAQQISDLAKKSVAVAENAGMLLDRTVPMIRDTSNLIQEIAAASQEQMAAIREINMGVSQLEEVVQQNAAASHELSGTSNDLAAHSTSLQQKVDFFQLDPTGNDYPGVTGPARVRLGPGLRGPAIPTRRLPAPGHRPGPSSTRDGQHDVAHSPPGQPAPPALPQHPGPVSPPTPPSNNRGTPSRGGVVVNLDDDDNFERFS
jgi:methyl-accepting chemotaxis protein